jgi:hypothetical protein
MCRQRLRHCLRLAAFHLGATPRWATETLAGPLMPFLRGGQFTGHKREKKIENLQTKKANIFTQKIVQKKNLKFR